MIKSLKNKIYQLLRWSEQYTKTDMVYLASSSFWMNANTIIINLFAFVLSIMFARFVSKEVYGTYQFIVSIGSIIGSVTLTGMSSAITQAVARGFEGTLKKSIKEQLRFAIIPFALGLAGSLYYLFSKNSTISLSLIAIAILLPLSNTFSVWGAYLQGKKDFKNIFLFNQILNISYYGGLITLIILLPLTIPLVITNFLLNTLSHGLIYFLILKKYKPNNQTDENALDYGKKLSLSNILPMIALNIDNLMIFHFLGAAQLAIYAFASTIPERLGGLLRPISTAAFPKMSGKTTAEIVQLIPKKTTQLFLISLAGGLLYVLLAPLIFHLILPNYTSSIIYSQIYTISVIIYITASFPFTALFATLSKHVFTINLSYPIYSIVFICLGAYLFGVWGVIIGKILSNILLFAQTKYYTSK